MWQVQKLQEKEMLLFWLELLKLLVLILEFEFFELLILELLFELLFLKLVYQISLEQRIPQTLQAQEKELVAPYQEGQGETSGALPESHRVQCERHLLSQW